MKKTTKTFVIGALAGAAAGVLLAPKSGKETRKELKIKVDELIEKAKKIDVEDVKNTIVKKAKELEEEIKSLDKEKVLKIAKEKGKKIEKKAEELYKRAKAKGTPVLQKTADELKKATADTLKKVIAKLEKDEKTSKTTKKAK